jgi:hypothetical protein
MRRWLLIFGIALLVAVAVFPPGVSKSTGKAAEITLAIATDSPLPFVICYDRDFDWPTGEALWIDFPAWLLHLFLLCCAVFFAILHYHRLHRKKLMLELSEQLYRQRVQSHERNAADPV